MKTRSLWTGMLLGLFSATSLAQAANPFIVIQAKDKGKAKAAQSGLLFSQADILVAKAPHAKSEDFTDLYWVNFHKASVSVNELKSYGEVLHSTAKEFAIMRLAEEKVGAVSALLHHMGMACGAVIKLNGDTLSDKKILDPTPILPIGNKLPGIETVIGKINSENIKATVTELSDLHTRLHSSSIGQTVGQKLMDMYLQHAWGREDVQILLWGHRGTPQSSLVVRIKGSTKPDEIVVLGSHIDSINQWGGSSARAPGADDNASGTATNLEIFRRLMEDNVRFERTLEIHGYAAEEIGLVGSQEIASQYRSQGKNVVAMVQFDMNIYNADGADKVWFISNNTNASLNSSLAQLLDQYVGVAHGSAILSGGNSDHYSWTRNSYAASFPFENPNNYNHFIHTSEDTKENAPRFSQAAAFAKLGIAYAMHFAGAVMAP